MKGSQKTSRGVKTLKITGRVSKTLILIMCAACAAGCSSSNSTEASTQNNSGMPNGSNTQPEVADEQTENLVGIVSDPSQPQQSVPTDPATDTQTVGEDSDTGEQSTQEQLETLVTFNIAVPAYQSDRLKVDLVYDDINLIAQWMGDEYWTASGTFLVGTEDDLVVTFYDWNGAITLARHVRAFEIETNADPDVNIAAADFVTTQFDDDGDGESNFAELAAGTDPLNDESQLLDVIDNYSFPATQVSTSRNFLSLTQFLENKLDDQRPNISSTTDFTPSVYEDEAEDPYFGTTITTDINIDAQGNGTVSHSVEERYLYDRDTGTRIRSENEVSWVGEHQWYDGDYSRRRSFTNEVGFVVEGVYTFAHTHDERYVGTYTDEWESSSSITAELIEGTSLCKPLFGEISRTNRTNRNSFPTETNVHSVSKGADDPYWTVIEIDPEGTIVQFLAREISILERATNEPTDLTFKCDLVDF